MGLRLQRIVPVVVQPGKVSFAITTSGGRATVISSLYNFSDCAMRLFLCSVSVMICAFEPSIFTPVMEARLSAKRPVAIICICFEGV